MKSRLARLRVHAPSLVLAMLITNAASAQNADQLAKQLANPLASLTSVPMQFNYEREGGLAGDADRVRLNIQPVIPMDLGDDWNLISRTILPVISQEAFAPGAGTARGIGDVTQSLFFSPEAATRRGWIWGVGPALLVPTSSDPALGVDRWAAGPTAVALRQTATGWTYGSLVNHLWSADDEPERADVSNTLLQVFASKRIGPGRTVSAVVESTYDWEGEQWTVPLHLSVSQVMRIGGQLMSFQLGAGRYVEAAGNAPDWGMRLTTTFMFPKQ
jgi:hypothetical protein